MNRDKYQTKEKDKFEKRVNTSDIEVRKEEDGSKKLIGYAVRWDKLSDEIGYYYTFREKFERGAFKNSLAKEEQKAHYNHDTSIMLGRTKNGTLKLEEDEKGLRFEVDLPDTTDGNDLHALVKRGDIDGVSFGFLPEVEEIDEKDPENVIRTVKEARLFEISPTPYPAYSQTSVQARSLTGYEKNKIKEKQIERQNKLDANKIKNKFTGVI